MGESTKVPNVTKGDAIFRAKLDGRREDCEGVKPGRDRGQTVPRPRTVDGSLRRSWGQTARSLTRPKTADGSPGRGQGQTARRAVAGAPVKARGVRRRACRDRGQTAGAPVEAAGDGERPGEPGDGRWETRSSPETDRRVKKCRKIRKRCRDRPPD